VLVDIDPVTRNIDPEKIEAAITERTSAVIPVHFAGIACNMDRIQSIARCHGLVIIEDCAHAIETSYHGRSVGTLGLFGCFSFYVTKNLTTGEGGMVLTDDAEKAARIKRLALHGMSADAWKRYGDEGYKHYYIIESGFKYNMMDIQAALGLHQLKKVNASLERRRVLRDQYNTAFASLPLTLPFSPPDPAEDACHLYSVLIDEKRTGISRDRFLERMTWHGIGVGVHYLSLPEHPFYRERFGWNPDDYPVAARIGRQTVSLPLSPKLSDGDINEVIEAVTLSLAGR
jgi:dTDP-4-amino-4,6-dideoxygalactose transaminase